MNGFSFSLKAASLRKKFKLNMVSDELIWAEIPMQKNNYKANISEREED